MVHDLTAPPSGWLSVDTLVVLDLAAADPFDDAEAEAVFVGVYVSLLRDDAVDCDS
jgi:hypothetical protein